MDDKFILYDVLNMEKNMVGNMAVALNEASCDKIYDIYYKMFDGVSLGAKNLFNIGYNNGWYMLEEQGKTKVKSSYDKLNKSLNEDC